MIEGVDVEEEALMYGVYLSDRVKYGGARQACTDESLSPKTIKSYVGTARKRLTMETGEVIQKTLRYREWMRKMMSVPGPSGFMAPAPPELVSTIVQNKKISIGVRAAVLSSFRFTLRMGECASRLTTVFNSARALRLGDVSFTVDEHGKRTAVIFYTRGSKMDATNTGGVRMTSAAQGNDEICPVRTLGAYYDACVAAGNSLDEPFFRHPDGKLVTTAQVCRAIKRTAVELGLDPRWYANHSMRIGASSAMTEADLSPEDKRIQGAWKTLVGSTPYMRHTAGGLLRTGRALALKKHVNEKINVIPSGRPRFERGSNGGELRPVL